jgi:hypothetical protein
VNFFAVVETLRAWPPDDEWARFETVVTRRTSGGRRLPQ